MKVYSDPISREKVGGAPIRKIIYTETPRSRLAVQHRKLFWAVSPIIVNLQPPRRHLRRQPRSQPRVGLLRAVSSTARPVRPFVGIAGLPSLLTFFQDVRDAPQHPRQV